MLLSDLEKKLKELKVPKDCYSLKGGLPNESLCLSYVKGIWEIYYSERGRKSGLKTYDNESDACEAFLIEIEKMLKLKPKPANRLQAFFEQILNKFF